MSKAKVDAWKPIKKPEDLFEVKEVPEGTYSPKCITDFKDLRDQALKQPLNEAMPVTKDDLLNAETAGLIGELKDGERAVALRVTPESLAGGFVLPGSKVDVMFIKKRNDEESKSQIILQDMLVLAVDMKNTRQEGETSMLGSTATLAAMPEEAEQLALAGSLGDLRLLLRRPGDTSPAKYKPVGLGDLARQTRLNDPKKSDDADPSSNANDNATATIPVIPKPDKTPTPAPVTVAEKTPDPVTHTLRIENGEDVSETVFEWDTKRDSWKVDPNAKKPDAKKSDGSAKPADAGMAQDAPKPPKTPAGNLEKAEQPTG